VTERITEKTIRKLRQEPPAPGPNGESRNLVVWDTEPKGFGVRITSAGAVAFVLRYVLDGRERRMTIGAYPDLSPSAARDEAIKLRGRIAIGDDPLANLEDRRLAPTVDQLCDRYIADPCRPSQQAKYGDDLQAAGRSAHPASARRPQGSGRQP